MMSPTKIATVFFLASASVALAAGGGGTSISLTNPLGSSCDNLSCPVAAVANFLFTLAIPLCGIMVLVGGFQMMTAAGNPEKISKGKKTILWSVIGFVIILISGSVAVLIQNIFKGS